MILAIRPGRAIYRARFPGTSMEPRLNFGPYAEAVLSSKSIAISDGHGWSFEARKNCSHKVASRTWPCTTSFTTLRGHNLLPVQTSIRTKTIKTRTLLAIHNLDTVKDWQRSKDSPRQVLFCVHFITQGQATMLTTSRDSIASFGVCFSSFGALETSRLSFCTA